MNYLKEILAFHSLLEINQLDPVDQALWFHLIHINNKCGWTEWFTVANMSLQARLGGVDKKTVERHRVNLINAKLIEYKNQGKKQAGKYRLIAPSSVFGGEIGGNIPLETSLSVSNNDLNSPPLNKQKDKQNETEKDIIPYREIISALNEMAGTSYKATTKKNQELIQARWNEGFRLNDFYAVIRKKVAQWKGTDSEQYLRPVTLFGTKFESYLNQPENIIPFNRSRGEAAPNDFGWEKV